MVSFATGGIRNVLYRGVVHNDYLLKTISELTYKVAAYSEIPNFNADECIDWAIDMLTKGHDSETLLILCGLTQPTNYFETIDYLKSTFNELGLTLKTGQEAIISYGGFLINNIVNKKDIRKNLNDISQFCIDTDYNESLYDFYSLYFAWQDIDYGETYQAYWPDAKPENIESIVINTARNWILKNKTHYAQHSV